MQNVTKAVIAAVILGASATSAQAFFGPFTNGWGSPWSSSDTMGWGDVDMNMRTTGWGRSSYHPYYAAPYHGYGVPAPVAPAVPVAAAPQAVAR